MDLARQDQGSKKDQVKIYVLNILKKFLFMIKYLQF